MINDTGNVRIIVGKKGTWYENCVGKVYLVERGNWAGIPIYRIFDETKRRMPCFISLDCAIPV